MLNNFHSNLEDLCEVFLLLETKIEVYNLLKDLCTPSELTALTERWMICKYLEEGKPYREIHRDTGISLTTIGRVARFLRNESYHGYTNVLKKIKKIKNKKSIK